MKTYPIIQDFAHLCIKMDDKITPQRREGVTIPDRSKTPYEQRWDAMSDLQKMQIKGMLESLSNEYIMEANGNQRL
jgi:hypothetical protein